MTAPKTPERGLEDRQISDLAALCRRLIHRLSKHEPDIKLVEQAKSYLTRHDLNGDILRASPIEATARTIVDEWLANPDPAEWGATLVERIDAALLSVQSAERTASAEREALAERRGVERMRAFVVERLEAHWDEIAIANDIRSLPADTQDGRCGK